MLFFGLLFFQMPWCWLTKLLFIITDITRHALLTSGKYPKILSSLGDFLLFLHQQFGEHDFTNIWSRSSGICCIHDHECGFQFDLKCWRGQRNILPTLLCIYIDIETPSLRQLVDCRDPCIFNMRIVVFCKPRWTLDILYGTYLFSTDTYSKLEGNLALSAIWAILEIVTVAHDSVCWFFILCFHELIFDL